MRTELNLSIILSSASHDALNEILQEIYKTQEYEYSSQQLQDAQETLKRDIKGALYKFIGTLKVNNTTYDNYTTF